MSESIPLQDLSADELRRALAETGEFQRDAVMDFISKIGGIENARLAIQMLYRIEYSQYQ